MKRLDLGDIRGEITLFGGPYSNVQALDALLQASAGSTRICTGDIVAYCGAPEACVAAVRAAGVHVVAGNCEQQLAAGALDCGCGFEDGTTCDLLSAGWYSYAAAQVSAQSRAWMGALPDIITFAQGATRYAVIHGGVRDVARFIWSVSEVEMAQEASFINEMCGDIDVVIAGHSGIAFARELGALRWINAGVIGMPPHDGTRQTQYLRLLQNGAVHFERLDYDVDGAVADMTRAGLTQGYHTALQTGYWPSEDVLPEALRVSSASRASG